MSPRARAASALLGLLAALLAPAPARAQRARRSVECASCIGNYYYFDENSAAGAHRDWNCATSSYDGHRGSDWSLSGGLGAIDAGHNVVAVADGTVVTVNDGAFDRCTSCPSSGTCGTSVGFGYGNYVRIDHGTRSVIYAHMRNGSVRVAVGARVTCGQVLGQIASSGCSTGAHLHTEFRAVGGSSTTAYDPYEGGCSPTRPSVWTMQNAHRTLPGATCDGSTVPPTCPAGTYPIWTCNAARTARVRCVDGVVMTEMCPAGCVPQPTGTNDYCAPTPMMCTAGLGPEWACNAARTGRSRCNAGRDQTEACMYGCTVNTPGDDTCNPPPMCPAGLGAEWVCTADGAARRRCVMGATQQEPCAGGCVSQAGDDACRQVTAQDGGGAPDGGSAQDAGASLDAGARPDAGAPSDARRDARVGGGGDSDTGIEGGCGCRAAGSAPAPTRAVSHLALAAVVAALAARRRRRQR